MTCAKDIVFEAIDQVNLDSSSDVKLEKDVDFLLLDQNSSVDSLLLVNLFVNIESLIEEKLNKLVSVVDEKSFESDQFPFKNIGNLILHIEGLIK